MEVYTLTIYKKGFNPGDWSVTPEEKYKNIEQYITIRADSVEEFKKKAGKVLKLPANIGKQVEASRQRRSTE